MCYNEMKFSLTHLRLTYLVWTSQWNVAILSSRSLIFLFELTISRSAANRFSAICVQFLTSVIDVRDSSPSGIRGDVRRATYSTCSNAE